MTKKIELYQRLRAHLPDEAASIIAEEMLLQTDVATTQDLHRVEIALEKLRSELFRTLLLFFLPLWIGVYATLAAILFRGAP